MTDGAEGYGIPTVPTRRLQGAEEAAYVKALASALKAARLNAHYPDARRLTAHLSVLAPETHRGLYPGLEVDLRSGLPSYKEWTRAQTDVAIAADQLRQLGSRAELAARAPTSPIHAKQLAKVDYYGAIQSAQLAPLAEMEVKLRRIEPEEHRAWFHVTLDKLDATGLFVRTSIDLSQVDQVFCERAVVLSEETARQTESFRSLIYKLTSLDAELTLVKLATTGGLAVERVVKGVVGPIWYPWSHAPEDVASLLGERGFVANFGLDMAALDVAEDRDNDPFEDPVAARLGPEAREGYEGARAKLGYHVFKDRKLVVPRELTGPVAALCAARGTKNIVYGV